MQIAEKERQAMLEAMKKEIVGIVASKCVHPDTNRLFSADIIEDALDHIGFGPKINDSAKKQANFCIKALSELYYLKKADMEIKVTVNSDWLKFLYDEQKEVIRECKPGLKQ